MLLNSLPLMLVAATATVRATTHHLIVGTFGAADLYTVAFDDVTLNLSLVHTTNVTADSSWISLSHDKKNLYGTFASGFASYAIENATSLTYSNYAPLGGNCTSSKAIFVVGSKEPPYDVYGTPFGGTAGCGVVMSVDSTGAIDKVVQNYTYLSTSGVHGLAFSPDGSIMYSADDTANSLWTHSVNSTTGEVTELSRISGPSTGSDPRHVAVHPNGTYLYAVLEGANALAVYSLDNTTGLPTYTNKTYPLIPSNATNTDYWSDEVAISASGSYLWATSRARSTSNTGYISAFSLSTSGVILKQLFLTPTTASGGTANSVAASDFSDKWVALTDSASSFVEIWTIAANGSQGEAVAHLDIDGEGCCANAVWYD